MELHEDPEALEELLFMKVGGGGSGANFYLRSSFPFPQAP